MNISSWSCATKLFAAAFVVGGVHKVLSIVSHVPYMEESLDYGMHPYKTVGASQ